ncbi:hypothetical protein AB0O28_31340 [Microbispora sp. NPDC088329]|uniref:hypothetical protein n=1 Tax=Microbispora sp. NPDC088329 TaxID=3154869 RepID=UPI003416479C
MSIGSEPPYRVAIPGGGTSASWMGAASAARADATTGDATTVSLRRSGVLP